MTTAQFIRAREVTRPSTTPLISSIFDHATVVDVDRDFGYRNNAGLWQSYNCLDTLVPTPDCANPLVEMDYKTFSVAGYTPAFQFSVHGGVKCSLMGLDRDEQKSELERVFDLNSPKGVEAALVANRFAEQTGPGSDDPVSPYYGVWDEPVDLNTDGASIGGAMAALESYAAGVYAGVPTLHMPRGAVLLAFGAGLVTERDGKFYSKTGAKIAAGGGYDNPDAVWSGSFDLYATGEVYIERSKKISHSAVVLPGDGSGEGSDQNGLGDNTGVALVERTFRAAVDCFVAKATGGGGLVSSGGDGGFGN